MYYIDPNYLSDEFQTNGLPLFREELKDVFRIISSRYKTSKDEYSEDLYFGVSFLPKSRYRPKGSNFGIGCIKVVYDQFKDPLSIKDSLQDSNLFQRCRSSRFSFNKFDEIKKGLFFPHSRYGLILFQPRILEAIDIISNGLKNNGFYSLDDLIIDSNDNQ